jgi:hypothetical protein
MDKGMINYYYEIADEVKVFGHNHKYLAHFDIKPTQFDHWRYFHDEAIKNSTRVWLENANGISLIKGPMGELVQERVDEYELVWLKLICKDVETL